MADKKPVARTRKLNIKQKKKAIKKTKPVRGALKIFFGACKHLWENKRLFGFILIVYLVLYFILVKGFATGFRLDETRRALEEVTSTGDISGFVTAAALFGALLGTAGSAASEAGAVYQTILFVIMSLVVIWTLRQTYEARQKPGFGSVFYQSMYPLIQYILILLVIVLQLLPTLAATIMYGIATSGGIIVGVFENIIWLLFLVLMVGLTVFLLSSSIFASYIVTLPGMTPMQALRSARKLVRFRRFMVIRKLAFFPLVVVVGMTALFLPLAFYATAIAEAAFLVFGLVLLLLVHAYFYMLYRELL